MNETTLVHDMVLLRAAAFITTKKLFERSMFKECEIVEFRYRLDCETITTKNLYESLSCDDYENFFRSVVFPANCENLECRTAHEVAEKFDIPAKILFMVEEREIKPIFRHLLKLENTFTHK